MTNAKEAAERDEIKLALAEKVDVFISQVFGGVHRVHKVENKGNYFQVIPHGTLATFDDDKLTRVVIASHQLGLRAEVDNHGMRGIKILLHNRTTRIGRLYERHPSTGDLLRAITERGE